MEIKINKINKHSLTLCCLSLYLRHFYFSCPRALNLSTIWIFCGLCSCFVFCVFCSLLTLPEHLSSLPGFYGVLVTQSLVLCVCFVNRCLSFCAFSFGHCVVCPSITDSDYPFGIFKLLLSVSCFWIVNTWLALRFSLPFSCFSTDNLLRNL